MLKNNHYGLQKIYAFFTKNSVHIILKCALENIEARETVANREVAMASINP